MIHSKKLTGFIGAEITGIDLKQSISPESAVDLRDHLSRHHVLVFRGQHLTLDQQKRLTEIFGPLMQLPYVEPMAEDANVIAVLKEAYETNVGVFGGDWHSDFSFMENPPLGSILNAVEIPHVGGDTLWASQVAAYDTLPKHLKDLLDTHQGIHMGKPYGVKYAPPVDTQANASIKMTRDDPAADLEIAHPCVITVSRTDGTGETNGTGEKAIFLNPIYTTRFDHLSEIESKPILQEIYQHCTRPDFCCRHTWQVGDIIIWDNRTTLHHATNDYDGERRLLYRTTFKGNPPV